MNVFAAAAQAIDQGAHCAMATVISVGGSTPRSSGARMLVYANGEILGTIGGGQLEHRTIAAALKVINSGAPMTLSVNLTRDLGMCCGGKVDVYIEPIQTRAPFVLFGAGHIAQALVPILSALEFSITVVDPRPELLDEERFPQVSRVVIDPLCWLTEQPIQPEAYWLVVTHDHALDQALVEALLPLPSAWLGLIGSRPKVSKFLIRYRAAGMPSKYFTRLSAPVGLDLGAETPAEIAVSIAAELVRVRSACHRPPLPLSHQPLPARDKP